MYFMIGVSVARSTISSSPNAITALRRLRVDVPATADALRLTMPEDWERWAHALDVKLLPKLLNRPRKLLPKLLRKLLHKLHKPLNKLPKPLPEQPKHSAMQSKQHEATPMLPTPHWSEP
jgi:hypothetical protein